MTALNRKNKDNEGKRDSAQAQGPLLNERPKAKTIVIQVLSTAQMPKALSSPTSRAQHAAWSRLDHLYRISNLLITTLDNIEQTVADVLAIITDIQPLISAILIRETNDHAHMVLWHAEDISEQKLRAAQRNAVASYGYLSGATCTLELNGIGHEDTPVETKSSPKQNFIVIPLVVRRGPTWGVVQLEAPTAFNEADLVFINAIGNQLAVALDRQNAADRELRAREQAEASERRMRFLAEASKLLAASLNYLHTWESMAQLATRHIADLCILDILEEDQSLHRLPTLSPNLPKEITEKQIEGALRNVVSEVMRSNWPVFYAEPRESQLRSPDIAESTNQSVVNECSDFCKSYMCVPLRVGERTLGTLTMISTRSAYLYSRTDLDLLEDLARRAVVAYENARSYGTALQAIRSRDDLLSIVSHDLKAPLAVISGFVSIFLKSAPSGEQVTCDTKHLEAIQRSAAQMNRLIEDLLATGSIEAKHVPVQRRLWAAVPIVSEALDLMEPLATRKGIQLQTHIPADINPIFADRDRIVQVFANLIDNAIKFSPSGGTITVAAKQLENEVQFSVEDNGPGIPDDQVTRVFDRFWQVPGTARKGTGLGLFIVKGIVEVHGGRVWVESKFGAGSTFFFTIPVNPRDDGMTSA